MKVTGNRSNDNLTKCTCRTRCQMRFQNLNTFLHSTSCNQHLRNKDLTIFEFLTNYRHCTDHTIIQNRNRIITLINGFLYSRSY